MSIFTQEDLLLYLYKETSAQQNALIEAALQQDYELRQSLATLQESIQLLDQPSVAPRTEVVLNVLNYAREVVETGA
ncbi:hypothetical protein L0U88_20290 [Flavihumibacter sp. RY-1]|jgi:hypothetical protein|uniref:Uncharacterized protein n=1 Tax=Flavihumibacter fluminis TaxID=2909236 RepID=A0ABS9BPQ2_9BACT|nr:hypothetical protein [Flavihumibacter fluminis]MBL7768434.1 hypothetical protein [Flavipsychrobacter sp.]MCF1716993.1 hypothetical protein [Flavihumibacter fluminis]